MDIHIEKEAFACTKFYSGTYTDEQENEFEFTISTSESENDDETITGITWTEEVPDKLEEIEEEIRKQF